MIRNSTLKPFKSWEQPTGQEIREALTMAGLSGAKCAELVGAGSGRTVRRWTSGDVPIPFAVWALICEAAGLGQIWKIEKELNE